MGRRRPARSIAEGGRQAAARGPRLSSAAPTSASRSTAARSPWARSASSTKLARSSLACASSRSPPSPMLSRSSASRPARHRRPRRSKRRSLALATLPLPPEPIARSGLPDRAASPDGDAELIEHAEPMTLAETDLIEARRGALPVAFDEPTQTAVPLALAAGTKDLEVTAGTRLVLEPDALRRDPRAPRSPDRVRRRESGRGDPRAGQHRRARSPAWHRARGSVRTSASSSRCASSRSSCASAAGSRARRSSDTPILEAEGSRTARATRSIVERYVRQAASQPCYQHLRSAHGSRNRHPLPARARSARPPRPPTSALRSHSSATRSSSSTRTSACATSTSAE